MNILAGENLPLNINLKYIFFTEWKCLHYSKSPTCLFWKMYILYVLTITLRFDTNTGRLLSHVTNSHWLLPLNYHFLQFFFIHFFLIKLSSLKRLLKETEKISLKVIRNLSFFARQLQTMLCDHVLSIYRLPSRASALPDIFGDGRN